ncbi:MAG: glutamate synthase central domain-containing protein, partial [bacterium]
MASEAGVLEIAPSRIAEKGRLGPGQMLLVDTARGRLLRDPEIKSAYARRRPYAKWTRHITRLPTVAPNGSGPDSGPLLRRQRMFGWSLEDVERILRPMADEGKDPVFSMGDDIPPAVLSDRPRPLYHYFKQRFAQVTNPAIDPLRERLVMSLTASLGARPSLLDETAEHARLLALSSPILLPDELHWIREQGPFTVRTIEARFPVDDGAEGFLRALDALIETACGAASEAPILIITDRPVDERWAPMPMLLAVAAVHHALIRRGLRYRTGLVAEAGEARDIHSIACLIGYGASAVHAYLALQTVVAEASDAHDAQQRIEAWRQAVEDGLLKIMSKMGISTVSAYQGAQVFEAVGLSRTVIEEHFTGTPSRLGGADLDEIAQAVLRRHAHAFLATGPLEEAGLV